MKIIFIHGDSGSGKSTYAELYAKMLCKKKDYRDFFRSSASNDIMQDYMGEDIFATDVVSRDFLRDISSNKTIKIQGFGVFRTLILMSGG